MRARLLGFVGVAAAAMAAPAMAAPAACFDSFGGPAGPSFDTVYPNYHWIQWVQARGGTCRALRPEELALFNGRVLEYPPEYTASVSPGMPPPVNPPLVSQPPTTATSVWLGDPARAAELVTVAYANRGRPTTAVSDTGRVIYLSDGVWRVYDVTWPNGYRRLVAVKMRETNDYVAMESGEDGQNWSSAVDLGR
jgi:hypothetical protein